MDEWTERWRDGWMKREAESRKGERQMKGSRQE
jgi:hypothetical protein